MKHSARLWLAFLLSPLAACGIVFAVFYLTGLDEWLGLRAMWRLVLLVTETGGILLGVPAYIIVRRRIQIRLVHCLLAGAIIGILGGVFGVGVGALAGLFFWIIGIWQNDLGAPALKPPTV